MLLPVSMTVAGQAHRSFTLDTLWQGVAAVRERQKSAKSCPCKKLEQVTNSKNWFRKSFLDARNDIL
jgi:hypothetical protein